MTTKRIALFLPSEIVDDPELRALPTEERMASLEALRLALLTDDGRVRRYIAATDHVRDAAWEISTAESNDEVNSALTALTKAITSDYKIPCSAYFDRRSRVLRVVMQTGYEAELLVPDEPELRRLKRDVQLSLSSGSGLPPVTRAIARELEQLLAQAGEDIDG